MGNYLYDDYEAKMKVTNDIINDNNFYKKLRQNFVSPKKIFTFVQVIFATFKCPPYHTKFLQIFYNNLNILEREEYFIIVENLYTDLTAKRLSFHESYNNFNTRLCDIRAKTFKDSNYNHPLVRPKKDALDYFFLYVNYHVYEFEKIKSQIKLIVKEVNTYPEKVGSDASIQKIVTDEERDNQRVEVTYIGNIVNRKKEGKGMQIIKNKSNGEIISTYLGEFSDDKRNGVGVVKTEENQLEGTFVNDEPDGKMAIYGGDSKIYLEYKNGKKNGRKIELINNGMIFTGELKDDEVANSFSIYNQGFFFTGKKLNEEEYEGVAYGVEEGAVDVGTFGKGFELKGEGFKYRNGSCMYCTFEEGNFVPSPCYFCRDDGYISCGFCDENGKLSGKDILTLIYSNNEYKGDLFINDYINGKKYGKHEYYWGDGDYEKIYANNYGVRYFNDDGDNDRIMEGTFAPNGFPRGPGYFTYKGTKYSGEYKLNDERCLFISNNRKAIRTRITHDARFNETTAKQFKTQVHN